MTKVELYGTKNSPLWESEWVIEDWHKTIEETVRRYLSEKNESADWILDDIVDFVEEALTGSYVLMVLYGRKKCGAFILDLDGMPVKDRIEEVLRPIIARYFKKKQGVRRCTSPK